ncbi:MAG: DUF4255 domain-containing protein [Burkholderiaceae bacterium]|jgi:hypothetical protein|nr:DUF4255 domain-containing protein [Burkholderiaceae bacterium]
MSSPLAIGAVSAVLRDLLDNGMIDASAAVGSAVKVTAVAPDTINLESAEEPPRLNLFLHQVTANAGWRNAGLPSRSAAGGERLTNAPLALDLHYLITAYGRANYEAEILLGYAMHLLHQRPVLDRAAIRACLNNPLDANLLPPAFQALSGSDLADQVELIKVSPAAMGNDEMSRLWTAIQTHYRPSAAYQVSVVLIEGAQPARAPLPVLSRGAVDAASKRERGVSVQPDLLPPLPTLLELKSPVQGNPALRLGETFSVSGVRLSGSGHRLRLTHRLAPQPIELPIPAQDVSDTQLRVTLPNDAAAQSTFAAGQWALTALFTPEGESWPRETNAVPLLLAPVAVLAGDAALGLPAVQLARGGVPSLVTVTIHARPRVRLAQTATLMLDTAQATAKPRATDADPLVFEFPGTLTPGQYWLRLRVDGADSLLIDRSGEPPVFDVSQRVTVP